MSRELRRFLLPSFCKPVLASMNSLARGFQRAEDVEEVGVVVLLARRGAEGDPEQLGLRAGTSTTPAGWETSTGIESKRSTTTH